MNHAKHHIGRQPPSAHNWTLSRISRVAVQVHPVPGGSHGAGINGSWSGLSATRDGVEGGSALVRAGVHHQKPKSDRVARTVHPVWWGMGSGKSL